MLQAAKMYQWEAALTVTDFVFLRTIKHGGQVTPQSSLFFFIRQVTSYLHIRMTIGQNMSILMGCCIPVYLLGGRVGWPSVHCR